jgi:hypothetical protein
MAKKVSHLDKLVKGAVQEGIDDLLGNNPKFSNYGEYLSQHIDKNKLYNKIEDFKNEQKIPEGTKGYAAQKALYGKIVDYVSSGELLDEKGKKTILEQELSGQKKGLTAKIGNVNVRVGNPFKMNKKGGEKYFNQVMGAFQDFNALMASGNYGAKMPSLKKSIDTLEEMNFLAPAIDVLKSHDLLSARKYKFLKNKVYKKVGTEHKKLVGDIKSRVALKTAAGIFGFLGFGLVLGNSQGVTGNTVEFSEVLSSTGSAIGVGCILIGLVLFLIFRKSK